ncbi:E3 ubiquitin-protein ligase TRIM71-like [Mytilus edulis]|uniref:E3 ubiquitin-protein ligase TRIM71-like n=1 Tax=Mytilus edulis TaxID=6550 RepID=UPI0039EE07B1
MSFSKYSNIRQTVVPCQMCEEENRIQWKCLQCNFFICDKCRKIHQKFKSSEEHKIVDIRHYPYELKEWGQFNDFNNIKCDKHIGKICCLFCKYCQEVVCPLCITKVHNTHEMTEISEGFNWTKQFLLESCSRTDQNLKTTTTHMLNLQKIRTEQHSKYSMEKQRIHNQESMLHKIIKEQSGELLNKLDARWESLITPIQFDENNVKEEEKELQTQKRCLVEATNSNNAIVVFKAAEKQKQIIKEKTTLIQVYKYNRIPNFVPVHVEKQTIASLFGNLEEISGPSLSKRRRYQIRKPGPSFLSKRILCS